MARLDSKSDTQLIYLAGSLIERLNTGFIFFSTLNFTFSPGKNY